MITIRILHYVHRRYYPYNTITKQYAREHPYHYASLWKTVYQRTENVADTKSLN